MLAIQPSSPAQGWTSSWLDDLSCPVATCESHGKKEVLPLHLWGELGQWPGLRCPHCPTVWPDATVLLRQRLPWKAPLWAAASSSFAALGVWFLPWPLAIKVAALALCLLSLLHAFTKTRQIHRRLDAGRLMLCLGEPAGPEQSPWEGHLLDQLASFQLPERQPAIGRELREVVEALRVRGLPFWRTLRHLQLQLRPSSLRQILQLSKSARLSDRERLSATIRASWLQEISLHEKEISQALIDLEEWVPSLFDLLQEWSLPSDEAPPLEEIRTSLREGRELLATIDDLLSPPDEVSSPPARR